MPKRTLRCTIESAADGWMVIWLGNSRVEASCRMTTKDGVIRLSGTVRTGPDYWIDRTIEITSSDNENGELRLAA